MRTKVDDVLRAEVARYRLRFACDDCVHFDPDRVACEHGYAASPRVTDLDARELSFCKEFELR